MRAQTQVEEMQPPLRIPLWNIATRIAFCFCFVYLGLFVLYFSPLWLQDLLFVKRESLLVLGGVWPMRWMVSWAGAHIFNIVGPVSLGVGYDGPYFWVQAFCLLVVSLLATGVWSVLDRRRNNYVTLHKSFRVVIRFTLAALMLEYGMVKVIPAQMPYPNLFELVRPFGHFLQMQVLWTYMGAAPAYEIFAGFAEALGGILLFVPRTTLLGALICLADLTNVLMINMSYGVANKLQVLHFILLSVFLLAPDVRRLANVFLLDRAVQPSTQPQLFPTRRANRAAIAVQVILGVYLVGAAMLTNPWRAASKPPLYGIWDVDQFSVDGQVRPPLLTDNGRWRRVIFDSGIIWQLNVNANEGAVAFQSPDDSFAYYRASISVRDKTLTLTDPDPETSRKDWNARFTFEHSAPDQLILDGEMDKHKLHLQLHLFDRNKFELVRSRFHWVQ